jgi:titin
MLALLLALAAGTLAEPTARVSAQPATTYEVNSNGDEGDITVGDGKCCIADQPCLEDPPPETPNPCTLRAAIQEANSTPERDEMTFNIIYDVTTCIYDVGVVETPPVTAICPTYTLPSISAPLTIDGTTQPGYSGTPIVELDGFNGNGVGVGPGVDGLTVSAGEDADHYPSIIRGVWIHGFTNNGITLQTHERTLVEGNWIGDVIGDVDDHVYFNTYDAVYINNIPNNVIGGTDPAKRNIISGNGIPSPETPGYGIRIAGASASGNRIEGNYIGTDPAGTLDKGNTEAGVYINGSPNNTLGGTTGTAPDGPCTGACNVISGNNGAGVEVRGAAAAGNVVTGNFIGTTADGLASRGNSGNGVLIDDASNNTIGGTTTAARNVISKNSTGIKVDGSSTANLIQGNYIGTDVLGTGDLGNSGDGVNLTAPGNTVGGTVPGARNVISGNNSQGIFIYGSSASGNVVQGNYIGTTASGTAVLANSDDGVYIYGAPGNTVGGATDAARNVIAYNGNGSGDDGVEMYGSGAQSNLVQGNHIGVNAAGEAAGNTGDGVRINAAQKNTIGGATAAEGNLILNNYCTGVDIVGTNAKENTVQGNVISSNGSGCALPEYRHGVQISGATASLNVVIGNLIGVDETGTLARGNAMEGVYVNGAPTNTIGGTEAGEGNVISDNGRGVTIYGAEATGNVVQGNFIGTDITGQITDPDGTPATGDELGNVNDGVFISRAPGNTIGGTEAGAGNVIAGSGAVGVEIYETDASGNYVQGNFIGTDITGMLDLGNVADGVFMNNAPSNVIGGTTAAARNVISGNGNSGVNISGAGATGNVVQGNYIGTDATGNNNNLGNGYDGVRVGAYSSNTSVGGTLAGAGNVIALNERNGVLVDRSTGNGILGNSVFSNGALGIDLVTATAGSGVTPNDLGDGDTGGNNYQNFPVLTSVESAGGSTTIIGTFNSTPSTNGFRLEFFSNETCDPLGHGEGETYLGYTTVNTDAGGNATVNVVLPVTVPDGRRVTATATDPANNTSEFSQCRRVGAILMGDVNGSSSVTMVDAMLIAQCVVGLIDCGTIDLEAADVNCSGPPPTMVDAMLVAQKVVGLIAQFPC